MKNIEKTELKAYKKPAVRVIDVHSESIIAASNGEYEEEFNG